MDMYLPIVSQNVVHTSPASLEELVEKVDSWAQQ